MVLASKRVMYQSKIADEVTCGVIDKKRCENARWGIGSVVERLVHIENVWS